MILHLLIKGIDFFIDFCCEIFFYKGNIRNTITVCHQRGEISAGNNCRINLCIRHTVFSLPQPVVIIILIQGIFIKGNDVMYSIADKYLINRIDTVGANVIGINTSAYNNILAHHETVSSPASCCPGYGI